MELIDLRETPTSEPAVGLADDSGDIVACAALRRVELGLELLSVTAGDAEHAVALVLEIAAVASAPRIVTALPDAWLEQRCGFVDGVLELRVEVAPPAAVAALTLDEVEAAIVASWGPDTTLCWSEANPSRGQCDATALVVRELFGGSIVCCNVVRDGQRVERHAWNILPAGLAVDLTRRQYEGDHGIAFETPVVREPHDIQGLSRRAALLSQRVHARLTMAAALRPSRRTSD